MGRFGPRHKRTGRGCVKMKAERQGEGNAGRGAGADSPPQPKRKPALLALWPWMSSLQTVRPSASAEAIQPVGCRSCSPSKLTQASPQSPYTVGGMSHPCLLNRNVTRTLGVGESPTGSEVDSMTCAVTRTPQGTNFLAFLGRCVKV